MKAIIIILLSLVLNPIDDLIKSTGLIQEELNLNLNQSLINIHKEARLNYNQARCVIIQIESDNKDIIYELIKSTIDLNELIGNNTHIGYKQINNSTYLFLTYIK